MQTLSRHGGVEGDRIGIRIDGAPSSAALIEVLWRRRGALCLTVIAAMALAGLYLIFAARVYSSTATVLIQQNAPKVYSETQGYQNLSETFLQTQADVFRSSAVLNRALEASNYRSMKTFAGVKDPAEWLRKGNALKVEVPRKADVVTITMESPSAAEAAAFANQIVSAYLIEQSRQKQFVGVEMVQVLQNQKQALLKQRDAAMAALLKYKLDKGVVSFKEDKNNAVFERLATLSTSLTAAQIAAMDLRAQEKSTQAAISNPATLSAFVASLQSKGRDSGDREYDELRRQMLQQALAVGQYNPAVGSNHPRMRMLESVGEELKKRIAEKDLDVAKAQLVSVQTQLAWAEEKERELNQSLKAQRDLALSLSPTATECIKLEADAARAQKQSEIVDARINELSANTAESGATNVQVLEAASPAQRPVKPNKILVLGAAMIIGWVLGIGLAMLRDWQDVRLRKPEEIRTLLGTPVVAMVPRINMKLSPVTRGQIVRLDARSPVAEAYRAARTSLHLGISSKAKTILVASPMEGDGKSTTASNLAIAFAQSGQRTLLIDGDLREPVQHLIFETEGRLGLTSVVAGETTLQNAIVPGGIPGLHVLPCGPVPVNPSELLTSKRFERLMRTLGESFDRIVIDSAPLMLFTDAQVLAASADVTLLVLRMNQSMRQLGMLAMDNLAKVGANVVGAVANDVAPPKGYRRYGGAWQYATPAAHLARGERSIEVRPAGRESARLAAEVLTISEPDWSADSKV